MSTTDHEEIENVRGKSVHRVILVTGASTHGQFGLYRWDMGPQPSGPSAHFHKDNLRDEVPSFPEGTNTQRKGKNP